MPTFRSAKEFVDWVTQQGNYELLPLENEDPLLCKIQRVEREGQLSIPGFVLVALRRKSDDG